MVALHDIEVRSGTAEATLQSRHDAVANKTLGQIVGTLFDTHVVPEGTEDPDDDDDRAFIGGIAIRMKIRLQLNRKDYDAAKQDIGDLVRLRNRLIHHFIEQHDLRTDVGCEAALADLHGAYERIDCCLVQLQKWAEWLDQSRQGAAAFFQSDEFRDALVLGILPNGTVAWPIAAIVKQFRCAWTLLSSDGWAVVEMAGEQVSALHPDLTPARHGCANWRHVLQESRQFDLRYFPIDGRRVACYRPRPGAAEQ